MWKSTNYNIKDCFKVIWYQMGFFFQVFYIQYQNDLISIPSDNILDILIS